jgi:hypothetical protein
MGGGRIKAVKQSQGGWGRWTPLYCQDLRSSCTEVYMCVMGLGERILDCKLAELERGGVLQPSKWTDSLGYVVHFEPTVSRAITSV